MRNPEESESSSMIKSIDPWLPPGIRNNTTLSLEGLIRSRVLTVIMISSMVTTAFGFFMCLFFQFITDHDFNNPIIISIVCFFLVGLDYLYFYKSAKLESSGILYSLTFFVLCIVAIVLTGGYHSPVKQILNRMSRHLFFNQWQTRRCLQCRVSICGRNHAAHPRQHWF